MWAQRGRWAAEADGSRRSVRGEDLCCLFLFSLSRTGALEHTCTSACTHSTSGSSFFPPASPVYDIKLGVKKNKIKALRCTN